MRRKNHRPMVVGGSDAVRAQEVEQEIESFLQALNSYADRFASDPRISFEEHLCCVATANQASGEEHQRRVS